MFFLQKRSLLAKISIKRVQNLSQNAGKHSVVLKPEHYDKKKCQIILLRENNTPKFGRDWGINLERIFKRGKKFY